MQRTENEPTMYKKRPFYGQTARKPRIKHGSPLSPAPAALDKHQGGRVRSWLTKNTWLPMVAVGWVFAFASEFALTGNDHVIAAVLAASFISFGIGWIVRDER